MRQTLISAPLKTVAPLSGIEKVVSLSSHIHVTLSNPICYQASKEGRICITLSDVLWTPQPLSWSWRSKRWSTLKKSLIANCKPFYHFLNLPYTKGFERLFVQSACAALAFLPFTGCCVGNRCCMGTHWFWDGVAGSGFTSAGYVTVSAVLPRTQPFKVNSLFLALLFVASTTGRSNKWLCASYERSCWLWSCRFFNLNCGYLESRFNWHATGHFIW